MSQPCIAWGEQHHLENGDIHRMLEWFDLLLKQKKQPEKRVRTYVMREDRWKTLEAWPAPVSRTEKLYLGETTLNATLTEGERTFVYDPETPVPSHGVESVLTTIAADLPEGQTYTPGQTAKVCVEMWDMNWTVQPGSCLRLDVSSSDFPQYAVHSNYAGVWSEQGKTRIAHQKILLGEGSFVELPLHEN